MFREDIILGVWWVESYRSDSIEIAIEKQIKVGQIKATVTAMATACGAKLYSK